MRPYFLQLFLQAKVSFTATCFLSNLSHDGEGTEKCPLLLWPKQERCVHQFSSNIQIEGLLLHQGRWLRHREGQCCNIRSWSHLIFLWIVFTFHGKITHHLDLLWVSFFLSNVYDVTYLRLSSFLATCKLFDYISFLFYFASFFWRIVDETTCKIGGVLFYIIGTTVGAGAHRLWSHKSYKASTLLKIYLMLGHTLAGHVSSQFRLLTLSV